MSVRTIKNVALYQDEGDVHFYLRSGLDEIRRQKPSSYCVPAMYVVELAEELSNQCWAAEIEIFSDVVPWLKANDIFEMDIVGTGFSMNSERVRGAAL